MLRFTLFSTPDEGPPLFKDHICVNRRVVSQEGDYCIRKVDITFGEGCTAIHLCALHMIKMSMGFILP